MYTQITAASAVPCLHIPPCSYHSAASCMEPTASRVMAQLPVLVLFAPLLGLTCISPAPGDGVGHAHHLGGEHDGGPELAAHKGGQAKPNKQAHNDVTDVVLQDGTGEV